MPQLHLATAVRPWKTPRPRRPYRSKEAQTELRMVRHGGEAVEDFASTVGGSGRPLYAWKLQFGHGGEAVENCRASSA